MNLVDFRGDRKKANCYGKIMGSSASMKGIYKMIADFSKYDYPVLITGETGTGKELVAEEIYNTSREADGGMRCLVKVNCAAIPEALIESELFGYKRGSFTGAIKDKKGKFQIADGGVLFLDEIGDAPLYTQAKILQVVERGEFQPLGYEEAEPIKVKVRIMAATNKNLKDEIEKGVFREDLFYRINVCGINLPPLWERDSDIVLLSRYFLEKHNEEYGERNSLGAETIERLQNCNWPGNVRQLENCIKKAAMRSDGDSGKERLKMALPEEETMAGAASGNRKLVLEPGQGLERCLEQYEKEIIESALRGSKYNVSKAARTLVISRQTLYKKFKHYGINPG